MARRQGRPEARAGRRRASLLVCLLLVCSAVIGGTIRGAAAAGAAPADCPAPTSLLDGGFETPAVVAGAAGTVAEGTMGLPWHTSAPDGQIELWHDGGETTTANGGTPVGPQAGAQWAEINASQAGTLYQDLPTVPGEILRWSLSHRGRQVSGEPADGADVMRVLIGAPAAAIPQTPEGQVVPNISDSPSGWGRYTGSYTIPAGQTTTRFAMIAVSTFAGDLAAGNFVDEIHFATAPCLHTSATVTNTDPSHGSLFEPGDVIHYSVTVADQGASDAAGTVLVATLPADVALVSGTLRTHGALLTDATGDDAGDAGVAPQAVTVRLGGGADATTGGVLAAGASVTVTVDARIDPNAGAGAAIDLSARTSYRWAPVATTLTADATATGARVDVAALTVGIVVSGSTDVDLDGRLNAGDAIEYEIGVHNTGSVALTALGVTDSATAPSCPSNALAPGSTLTCTATHTLTQAEVDADTGTFASTASAVATPPGGAEPIASGPATVTQAIARNPHLVTTSVTDHAGYVVGAPIAYTITVANSGGGAGAGTLSDVVPSTVAVGSVSCVAGPGASCDTAGSSGNSVAGQVGLAPASNVVYTVTGVVRSAGSVADAAAVTVSTAGCTTQCGGGTAASSAVSAAGAPNVLATVSSDAASYIVGQAIQYTVVVGNDGAGPGIATVHDLVPATVGNVSVSCAPGVGASCDTSGSTGNTVRGNVTLAPGATAAYRINGTLVATGDATDTVTVDPDGLGGTSGCVGQCGGGTATTAPLVVAAPPVFVQTKVSDQAAYIVGQPIVYEVTVSNVGSGSGTAHLTDSLQPAVRPVSFSCEPGPGASCDRTSPSGPTVTADLTLAPGASVVYTITGVVTSAGSLADAANIVPTTVGCFAQCGGGAATVGPVTGSANPVFDQSVSADGTSYIVGQPITYTVTVHNLGGGPGSALVYDQIVDRVSVSAVTCTASSGSVCSSRWLAGRLIRERVTLTAGGSAVYVVTGLVTATGGLSGLVDVDPVLTPDNPDGTTGCVDQCRGGAAATPGMIALDEPTFAATVVADAPSYIVGQPITYTITITNTGAGAGTVDLSDQVPAMVGIVSVGCTPETVGVICSNHRTAGLVTSRFTLPAAGVGRLIITGTVLVPGDLANTGVLRPMTAGCAAQCGGGVSGTGPLPAADKPVFVQTKVADRVSYNVGDPIRYTITVANAGAGEGRAGLTDPMPAGVTLERVTCTATPGSDCDIAAPAGDVVSGSVRIAPAGTAVYTVLGTVRQSGDVLNVATVDPSASSAAGTPGCASQCGGGLASTAGLPAAPSADLAIGLHTAATAVIGGRVGYSATATNNGPDAATGVHILTVLPSALIGVAGHVEGTTTACVVRPSTAADRAAVSPTGRAQSPTAHATTVDCRVAVLPSGSTVRTAITATVSPETQNGVALRVMASAVGATHDPDHRNNVAAALSTSAAEADLSLTSVASGRVALYGMAHFTVTLHNAGPSAATGVVVVDTPHGLTRYSAVWTAGTYDVSSGRWSIALLPAGSTATLSLVQQVRSADAHLVAVIAASDVADPEPGNNGGTRGCSVPACAVVARTVVDAALANTGSNSRGSAELGLSVIALGFAGVLAGRRPRRSSQRRRRP